MTHPRCTFLLWVHGAPTMTDFLRTPSKRTSCPPHGTGSACIRYWDILYIEGKEKNIYKNKYLNYWDCSPAGGIQECLRLWNLCLGSRGGVARDKWSHTGNVETRHLQYISCGESFMSVCFIIMHVHVCFWCRYLWTRMRSLCWVDSLFWVTTVQTCKALSASVLTSRWVFHYHIYSCILSYVNT